MAQRPVVSDMRFSLGLVSFPGDLVPTKVANSAKETSFSMTCPECPTPTKVAQQYTCANGHGPFAQGDTTRAKDVGGQLVAVTAEEIESTKVDAVPAKTFDIAVFPAGPVEACTVPDAGVYWVRPGLRAEKAYHLFLEAASNREVALIGEFVLKKGTTKMGRLCVIDGQLAVATLVRPSDVEPAEVVPEADVSEREREMMSKLIAGATELFDPDSYANTMKERVRALIEAKAADPNATIAIPAPAKAESADDLESLLQAMLDQQAAA